MSIREQFSLLNKDQQQLIELLAMAYLPLQVEEAADLMNSLGLKRQDGRRFMADYLRIEALELLRSGILLGDTTEVELREDWYEMITRFLSKQSNFRSFADRLKAEWQNGTESWKTPRELLRDIRLAFYSGQEEEYRRLIQRARVLFPISYAKGEFSKTLYRDFDPDWLSSQSVKRQNKTVAAYIPRLLKEPEGWTELRQFLVEQAQIEDPAAVDLRHALFLWYLYSGKWSMVQDQINTEANAEARRFRLSSYFFVLGQYEINQDSFQKTLKAHREVTGVTNAFPADESGLFFLFGLINAHTNAAAKPLRIQLKNVPDGPYANAFDALRLLADFLDQKEEEARIKLRALAGREQNTIETLSILLVAYWMDADLSLDFFEYAEKLTVDLWEYGLNWLAYEMSTLLVELHPQSEFREAHRQYLVTWKPENPSPSLGRLFPRREPWQRTLDALLLMGNGQDTVRGKRLVWYIDFDREELEVKEQSEKKNGGWTAGRKVPLKQLRDGNLEYMLAQDVEAGKAVRNRYGYRYSYNEYELELDFPRAMLALAGHPHLYLLKNRKVPVEILREEARLLVEETGIGYELRFNHPFDRSGILLVKETPTRFLVMHISERQAQLGRALGDGVSAPPEARDRIEEVTRRLRGQVQIQKALGDDALQVERRPGDPRPCLHLLPLEEGFKLEFFVKPLIDQPPYRKPGQGSNRLSIDTVNGPIVCVRDAVAEVESAERILQACPTLISLPHHNYEWLINDTETCLQILSEIYPLRANGQLTLEHPRGEKVRLHGIVGLDSLRLRVKKDRDWFEVSGDLMIDESQVINFRELLEKVNSSDSDFVELSDGQFLALTESLRQQLLGMGGLLQDQAGHLTIPQLGVMQIDDFTEQLAEFEADAAWLETLQRIRSLQDLQVELPAGLQAELRPYQEEGFQWLMRLAEWGVGACLADDMGLGKTVQALAVILARTNLGPSLVIAPASVTRNWERESHKFTPTLNPILLGPGDRKRVIESVGPNDLLLVSYGLLPFVGEDLAAQQFATVVLDEAQAIKNRSTKRSKAAMALRADFRMATTGTPIENHLGELWNLFRYLNPGLLGSHRHFNEQFAQPIARYDDRGRREQLRKIIQPFVLRRRKEEVLKDLPPKTEVTLNVSLSPEERAFYEALRRRALEEISKTEGASQRFTVLAQLTKLRQAACHPKMVEPSTELGSAKLDLVATTILELLDNGHKALIFSQFVKHLRLVEKWVKKSGIPYQYLDGQTPGAQRDKAVQAFQGGEGQLFLISLKAGGTGLNLTEADYVLHLDPWWNPAVEDQASDRAHRIGQQRPVTVYRFVTEDTIEEKIVKLHHEKRDLAESLLAGTEASASLTVDQMMDLIREGSMVVRE